MRRLLLLALLGATGLICTANSSAVAMPYNAYVGCSEFAGAMPSHICQLGDEPGAFFESPLADVEYEVCVTFPDTNTLCSEEEKAEEGVRYVNVITTSQPGEHLATWYVEGVEVAAWGFRIEAPEEPKPPSNQPPASTPTMPPASTPPPAWPSPTGPSTACRKAKQRVQALRAKVRSARGAKARAKARKRLRAARLVAKGAC